MEEYLVQGASLTTVADAIREKGGTTAPLSFPNGMAEAVRSIQNGGDLSLGLTAATVGQTVKVKAVDTDGKPTAWEAVDIVALPDITIMTQDEFDAAAAAGTLDAHKLYAVPFISAAQTVNEPPSTEELS